MMTYIYLNYENMKNVVASLASYADKAEKARSDVVTANDYSNNPSHLSNVSKLSKKLQELRDKTKEIDDRIEVAKAQSESGVSVKDESTGMISYYLPDNVEDSSKNVNSANQAILDAKKAKETTDDEELNQLLTGSAFSNKDDPVYSSMFSEQMGAEGMAELADRMRRRWDIWKDSPSYPPGSDPSEEYDKKYAEYLQGLSALSGNIATASKSSVWDSDKKTAYANDLVKLATDPNAPPHGPRSFNLLLAGGDRSVENSATVNGQNISVGGVFDKQFILTVAQGVEEYERSSGGYPEWMRKYNMSTSGASLAGSRGEWDPFTGALTAMGRNPEASLEYLAPLSKDDATEGDFAKGKTPPIDESRLKWLIDRMGSDSDSKEAFTTAFAGASELRQKTADITDERAAWLTERGVTNLGGDKFDMPSSSTAISKRNISVLLANSMQDVDAGVQNASHGNQTAFISSRPAYWSENHPDEVRKLLQVSGTDDKALATLGESAGRFASERQRVNFGAGGDPMRVLGNDTRDGARLFGYIAGAAQKGRERDLDSKRQGANLFLDAVGKGLSFLPSPASPAVGAGVSIMKSYAFDAGTKAIGIGSENPDASVNKMGEVSMMQIRANGYNILQRAGKIPDEAIRDHENKPYEYPWLDASTGVVDIGQLTRSGNANEPTQEYNGFMLDPDLAEWKEYDDWSKEVYDDAFKKGKE